MVKVSPVKIASRFRKLEVILATLLLMLPLILILVSGEVRPSISDYAYSDVENLFSGLLWASGLMFIYNGFLKKKWYNIVLGVSLIGVSLTPHLNYPIIHYLFAIIFFLGSIFIMIFFSSKEQRKYKVMAGLLIFNALLAHFIFSAYSLLVAEWIGIVPICVHFIGESLNKID